MTEMELRSLMASLEPSRDNLNLCRDFASWYGIVLPMRMLEGTYEEYGFPLISMDGNRKAWMFIVDVEDRA